MGQFARAFSAALKAAGRNHTEAAALAGLTQASVSRTAAGTTLPDPANLAKLLLALDPEDRNHALRQYLLEHTPEEYHGRILLSFTEKDAPRAHLDPLAEALAYLEKEATHEVHLRRVLIELAITMGHKGELPATVEPSSEHIAATIAAVSPAKLSAALHQSPDARRARAKHLQPRS